MKTSQKEIIFASILASVLSLAYLLINLVLGTVNSFVFTNTWILYFGFFTSFMTINIYRHVNRK